VLPVGVLLDHHDDAQFPAIDNYYIMATSRSQLLLNAIVATTNIVIL
jgi:hypothetical protein